MGITFSCVFRMHASLFIFCFRIKRIFRIFISGDLSNCCVPGCMMMGFWFRLMSKVFFAVGLFCAKVFILC